MRWRANLTTTDGRKVAIGDAHRCEVGSKELLDAAYLLEDHTLAWIVKSIHERVHGGYLLSPQQLLTFNASFRLENHNIIMLTIYGADMVFTVPDGMRMITSS